MKGYWSRPSDWKFQYTTPNASTLYVYFNYHTGDGPLVLEVPPTLGTGLFGTMLDAWQVPRADVGPEGEDKGEGGKYLLLPPGYQQQVPDGYIAVPQETYNGYALLRAIPTTSSREDTEKALDLVRKLHLYQLSQAANPPQQRHIDMAGQVVDGIVRFDDTFFDALAMMVDEEPVQTRDLVAFAELRSIGIEKGKQFVPDAGTREVLKEAIVEVHAAFMDAVTRVKPYWEGLQWGLHIKVGPQTGFSFLAPEGTYDIDERALTYFMAFAPPKKLGRATFYLGGVRDSNGEQLHGEKSYRLNIPADVPVRQYWAVTVYDLRTAAFITESPKLGIDSYDPTVEKNEDGSVDVYFGPKAPEGKEFNWVYTAPGKPWFVFFRFYGSEKAVFDKTWRLSDIEPIP
jgi:hypothetical protein